MEELHVKICTIHGDLVNEGYSVELFSFVLMAVENANGTTGLLPRACTNCQRNTIRFDWLDIDFRFSLYFETDHDVAGSPAIGQLTANIGFRSVCTKLNGMGIRPSLGTQCWTGCVGKLATLGRELCQTLQLMIMISTGV